uniref:Uncharacterized protein n=1 Tax=Ditylenchus dipsaci TaxID=166011 RepID=A0A915EI81_9BILA
MAQTKYRLTSFHRLICRWPIGLVDIGHVVVVFCAFTKSNAHEVRTQFQLPPTRQARTTELLQQIAN